METGTLDPAHGTHVDPESPGRPPARPPQARAGRPIDIVLRSSPPGATAAVDGVLIGPTPAYWAGEANGHEHEFTFVLSGYAFARYRFVPITSGVVHARLEVLTEDTDAGVPSEMIRVVPDATAPGDAQRPRPPQVPPVAAPAAPDAAPTPGPPDAAPSAPERPAPPPDGG